MTRSSGTPSSHRLDGNALAGPLADVFGVDVTTAVAHCRGCSAAQPLGSAVVWAASPGWVVRCRGCDLVLATLVVADGRRFLAMPGISALEFAAR